MEYPFIPLDLLIADVQAQYKTLNQQGTFNEEDAYVYAVEATREVGVSNYDEDTVSIPIRNHIGALPRDFYNVKEIWISQLDDDRPRSADNGIVPFQDATLSRRQIIVPGDTATVRYCADKQTPFLAANTPTYVLRIPPGTIRTSIRNATIELNYNHLTKDARGVICVQDEINTIKAVKAYILLNTIKPDYVMGKIARYIYKDIEEEYLVALDMAQAMLKFPDPSTDKAQAMKTRNKYNNFNL